MYLNCVPGGTPVKIRVTIAPFPPLFPPLPGLPEEPPPPPAATSTIFTIDGYVGDVQKFSLVEGVVSTIGEIEGKSIVIVPPESAGPPSGIFMNPGASCVVIAPDTNPD
jgi:hypothetical protein